MNVFVAGVVILDPGGGGGGGGGGCRYCNHHHRRHMYYIFFIMFPFMFGVIVNIIRHYKGYLPRLLLSLVVDNEKGCDTIILTWGDCLSACLSVCLSVGPSCHARVCVLLQGLNCVKFWPPYTHTHTHTHTHTCTHARKLRQIQIWMDVRIMYLPPPPHVQLSALRLASFKNIQKIK